MEEGDIRMTVYKCQYQGNCLSKVAVKKEDINLLNIDYYKTLVCNPLLFIHRVLASLVSK